MLSSTAAAILAIGFILGMYALGCGLEDLGDGIRDGLEALAGALSGGDDDAAD